ncbi:MAG: heavy-metal-associated domain-containing protein [Clostridia bacterium]|nr:heavy-metal-associated domain-containing protein [Clostridia bacterium]
MMKLIVEGMKCIHCVKRITNALQDVNATNVEINLDDKSVTFDGITKETAIREIEDLGFEVKV